MGRGKLVPVGQPQGCGVGRRRTRTGWRVLAAVTVLSLVVAACGTNGESSPEDGSDESTASDGPVRVWKFGAPPTTREHLLTTTETLAETEDGLEYETEFFDFDVAPQRIASANASDNLPDIVNFEHSILPELAGLGIIRSLSEIDPDMVSEWEEHYVPEAWDLGMHEGEVYGFSPYVDLSPMLVYNTEMFEEAGVDEPESWSEVLAAAQQLQTPDRAGIVFAATNLGLDLDILESLAHANGARYFDESTGEAAMLDAGWTDTLEFLDSLQDFAPPGLTDVFFREALQLFYQEQAAMVITKSFAPVLQQDFDVAEDFPRSIIPFPSPDQPSGAFEPQPMHAQAPFIWSITRQVGNLDAAMTYMDWWADPAQHSAWGDGTIPGRVPVTEAMLEGDGFAETFPTLAERHSEGELFPGVASIPRFIGRKEAQQAFGTSLQQYLLGQAGASEALESADNMVSQIAP